MSLSRINFKLYIDVFYRPPSSSPVIFDLLCNSLSQYVYQSYFSNFVIVGDFNVDFTCTHPLYGHLSDFMTSFCLSQIVDSPTHFSPTGKPSLIDLVFVSNLHSCLNCTTIPQLANSDHFGLSLSMKTDHLPSNSFPRRRVWRYKHADFQRANEMLCDLNLNDILDPGLYLYRYRYWYRCLYSWYRHSIGIGKLITYTDFAFLNLINPFSPTRMRKNRSRGYERS